MRKILMIIVLTAGLLLLIAAFADPTIRYPYIGVQLERDLSSLEGTDPITVLLSVETGTEVVPEAQLGQDPTVQDEYSLLMILREEIKAQQVSASANYEVEEMESEQWAWKEVELNKLKARTQIFPRQIALAPQLTFPKPSIMASEEVWTPLITSLWPKLPTGFQKAGKSSWQEQLSFEHKNPMSGQATQVNYNMVYRLDKFINTDQGILANILVLGSISEGTEVEPSVEVRGTIKGFVLLEPSSGRAYGGEYRIEEQFMIKQPDLPVLRKTTYQGAKFWRPMFYKMSQMRPDLQVNPEGQAASPSPNPGVQE